MIFRGEDFAGDGSGGLHDEAADLAFEFGEHACVVRRGSFASFGDDLLGSGDGLLRFLFLDFGGRGARFFNQFCRLGAGLRDHFLTLGFRAAELDFNFIGIGQSFGDALAPFFQHCQHALVRELVEHGANNAEADDLRDEVRPIDAESSGDLLDRALRVGFSEQDEWIHKFRLKRAQSRCDSAPGSIPLADQEQSVEHDGFGKRDGQNRLDQDLRRRAGIASHSF